MEEIQITGDDWEERFTLRWKIKRGLARRWARLTRPHLVIIAGGAVGLAAGLLLAWRLL